MDYPSAGTTSGSGGGAGGGGAMTFTTFGVDNGDPSQYLWGHSDLDPALAAVISFDAAGAFTYSDLDRRTSVGASSVNGVSGPSPILDGISSGRDGDPSTTNTPLLPQSAVFASLVRQFANRQPPTQPRRSHIPATLPCDGSFPTAWDLSFVKSSPEIDQRYQAHHSSCSSSPTVEDLLHFDANLTPDLSQDWTGLPPTSADPLVPVTSGSNDACLLSAAEFNTTFDSLDVPYPSTGSVSCSTSTGHDVSFVTESYYAPSPTTTVTLEHKTRASTVEVTAPNLARPSSAAKPRKPTKNSGSLSFIQYKPSGGDGRLTKKRPALDEVVSEEEEEAPQTLRHIDLVNGKGQVHGTMSTFGKRVKTRTAFTPEKRQQTALARREGVCARCKKSKRQCDLALTVSPYISCTLCACTKLYKNVSRMPCFRSTLMDILFFRAGPAANEPLFTKRDAIYHLADPSKPDVPVRTLKLTQKIGAHQLTVYASEYVPKPEDVTSYKWKDSSGKSHEIPMPYFCLTNIDKVYSHYLQYIEEAKWDYLKSLQSDDGLSWMTVKMAMDYAQKKPDSLVAHSLQLWAISRMIEIPWEMCGEDTLGVERIMNPENPHHNKIPIPPIMDTQLDQIVIQNILKPLRGRVINAFEQLITPAKPEVWFEIYLAAFVMLNHIERLAKHSVNHARTHCMPTRYSNVKFLEAAFHTAKVILSRFHFVCNGSAPLRCNWDSPKTIQMAKLESSEVEFMKKTQDMIRERETAVLSLRTNREYESSLYWSHQLFFENWDKSANNTIEEIC